MRCVAAAAIAAARRPPAAPTAPTRRRRRRERSAQPPATPSQRRRPEWCATTIPVVRNGKVILWHGAWRDGSRRRTRARAPRPGAERQGPGPERRRPRAAAQPKRRTVSPCSPIPTTPARADWPATSSLRCTAGGADGRIVAGGVSAAALGAAVDGDRADLAIAPLDALVADPQASAAWRERAPFIAKLSGEPIEIIAARDVADLRQLAGREVGFGPADSADAASAAILFNALGVAPRPAYEPLADALDDLAAGRLAAVVAVDGRCAPAIAAVRRRQALPRTRRSLDAGAAVALRAGAPDRQGSPQPHRRRGKDRHRRRAARADRARRRARLAARPGGGGAGQDLLRGLRPTARPRQGRRLARRQSRRRGAVAAPARGAGMDRRGAAGLRPVARSVPRRRAQRGERRRRPGGAGFRSALRQSDAMARGGAINGGA